MSATSGYCHTKTAMSATKLSSPTLAMPLLTGSGEVSIAKRTPSLVSTVPVARPPASNPTPRTHTGAAPHSVSTASSVAAGGRMAVCTASHAEAIPGTSVAPNSMTVSSVAMAMTHGDASGATAEGSAAIQPA